MKSNLAKVCTNLRKVGRDKVENARDVADALRSATATLTDAGVDSPRLCAELLLSCVLDCDRLRLMTSPSRALTPGQTKRFRRFVQRRAGHEPVQHIIGRTEFWSLPILCDRRALVPRPETELLVATALEFARGMSAPLIADIGTGTGCVAIALAAELPEARIIATDISDEALELAAENIRLSAECRAQSAERRMHNNGTDTAERPHAAFQSRIRNQKSEIRNRPSSVSVSPCLRGETLFSQGRICLRRGDLLSPLAPEGPGAFDMILSNPPYIPDGEIASLQPEVRDFDPGLALRGGPEGCTIIIRLLREAPRALRAGGFLVMEIGAGQLAAVKKHAKGNWKLVRVTHDGAGIERIVTLQKEI